MDSRIKTILFAGLLLLCASIAQATVFADVSFESATCGNQIASGTIDGSVFDVSSYPNVLCVPYYRCAVGSTLGGTDYLRFEVPQVETEDPHGTGPDITFASPITVVSGTTYYLAALFRFDKISGATIWHNTWDFDKLLEMTGTGYRWIIESGYVEEANPYSADHFVFSAYASDAIFPGWTYYSHNYSGYTVSAPLMTDYSTWYSVVMGVTAHVSSGTVKMWINGTQVINTTGIPTMLETANINKITYSGTVGQPQYNAPPHYRYLDKIMLSNSIDDITAAGYFADPNGGGTPVESTGCMLLIN